VRHVASKEEDAPQERELAAGEFAAGEGAWCAGRGHGLAGGIPGGEIGARAGWGGGSRVRHAGEDARGVAGAR
jgi:hypothetical protein